jgi:hypothetical protein
LFEDLSWCRIPGQLTESEQLKYVEMTYSALEYPEYEPALVPHSHFRGIEYSNFRSADVDLAEIGLAKLVALVQHHYGLLHELTECIPVS